MAYSDIQSAYLFHRRNRGARALRAFDLAKADIDAKARALVAEMRKAIREGKQAGAAICEALRAKLADCAAQWEAAREEREALADNFYYRESGKSIAIADFARVNL